MAKKDTVERLAGDVNAIIGRSRYTLQRVVGDQITTAKVSVASTAIRAPRRS